MADVSDSELGETYQAIRTDSNPTNWAVLGYEGNSKIVLQGKGSGGLPELAEQLQEDQAQYAYLRVTSGDEESKRTKFVLISWCGEGVVGMKKGVFGNQAQEAALLFKGFHVQLNARNEKDLNENQLIEKLKKATGASYDSGEKVQGSAKMVPQSVAQGREQALQSNVKSKQADKSDYNKKDESKQFWNQTQQEEEERKKAQQPKPRSDIQPQSSSERNKFWEQQNKEQPPKSAPPSRPPANKPPPRQEEVILVEEVIPAEEPQQESGWSEPVDEGQSFQEQTPVEEAPYTEVVQETQYTEETTQETQYTEEAPYTEEAQYTEETTQETQYTEQSSATGYAVKALYDYEGENPDDLTFKEGQTINVLDDTDPSGWFQGELNGVTGFFPSNFVEKI